MSDAPTSESSNAAQKAAPQSVSAEDFLTDSALFVTMRVEGFQPPQQISFECPGECGKETTWFRTYDPIVLGTDIKGSTNVPDHSLKVVAYTCFLCRKKHLTVAYRETKWETRITSPQSTGMTRFSSPPSQYKLLVEVMKVGQYPEPSVKLSKALSNNLGKEASGLYRKALICRNNGFGLAAVGYMRRVVEDKTNELIEIAATLAESHAVDAATVSKMRAAADSTTYTRYEDKLQVAATVFPAGLKVGTVNPLAVLYTLVSKGLHGLSEPDCIAVADETKDVFEYVFEKLKAEVTDRRAFEERVKKLL
jgi:hypothetical protein